MADSSTAAYLGELDSQPTRASLPITNDAGIVQVSPGAGAVDLTRPAEGYEDSPDRYRPSRNPTFARVVPADDAEARAMAELAAGLDARTISAVSDGTRYGDLMVADFTRAAEEAGLQVPEEAAAVDLSFSAKESDGLRLSGPEATYAGSPVLDPANLADPAFAADFESRFERPPGPYAAYGYEAMSLVLAAIAEADPDSTDYRRARGRRGPGRRRGRTRSSATTRSPRTATRPCARSSRTGSTETSARPRSRSARAADTPSRRWPLRRCAGEPGPGAADSLGVIADPSSWLL